MFDHMYSGPTELILDEYAEPREPWRHGEYVFVGQVSKVSAAGLESEAWESRMPSRFYKVLVNNTAGLCVGTFETGSGPGVGSLVSDLCHALARGDATLEGSTAHAGAVNLFQVDGGLSSFALVTSDDELLGRVSTFTLGNMLTFSPESLDSCLTLFTRHQRGL
jgi:hypothetical protein